jgi:hypothetical protein
LKLGATRTVKLPITAALAVPQGTFKLQAKKETPKPSTEAILNSSNVIVKNTVAEAIRG